MRGEKNTATMIKILKSSPEEIEERRRNRVKKEIEFLTEDLEMIELKLEKLRKER